MDSIEPPKLSKRQIECLKGVAEHLDSHQIAQRLGISPHTVDGHIAAAIKALGAMSRRDAVKRLGSLNGQSLTGQIPLVDCSEPTAPIPSTPTAAHETPSLIEAVSKADEVERGQTDDVKLHPLRTIGMIAAIAVAIVILLLAMDPLVQSAARLANAIQPPRTIK